MRFMVYAHFCQFRKGTGTYGSKRTTCGWVQNTGSDLSVTYTDPVHSFLGQKHGKYLKILPPDSKHWSAGIEQKNDVVPVERNSKKEMKDKLNRKFETIKLGSYLISGHHCLAVDEYLELLKHFYITNVT
jgi:hypothetical protein